MGIQTCVYKHMKMWESHGVSYFDMICPCFSSLIPETCCLEALRPFTRHDCVDLCVSWNKKKHHPILFCELRHEFNWTKIEFRNPNHVGSRHQLYFNWGYHQIVRKHHNGSCILSQELAFLALLRGSRGGTQQQNFPPKQVPKKKQQCSGFIQGEISGTFGARNPSGIGPSQRISLQLQGLSRLAGRLAPAT